MPGTAGGLLSSVPALGTESVRIGQCFCHVPFNSVLARKQTLDGYRSLQSAETCFLEQYTVMGIVPWNCSMCT